MVLIHYHVPTYLHGTLESWDQASLFCKKVNIKKNIEKSKSDINLLEELGRIGNSRWTMKVPNEPCKISPSAFNQLLHF